MWDPASYIDLAQPVLAAGPVGSGTTTAAAVDAATRVVAVGTDSGGPWFVDLDSGQVHWSQESNAARIVSIEFADEGRLAVTADALGSLSTWDPRTGSRISELLLPSHPFENATLGGAAVAPDGRRVAVSADGYGLRVIDVVDGTQSAAVYPNVLPGTDILRVLNWTPDGRYVLLSAQELEKSHGYYTVTKSGAWTLVDPVTGEVVWVTNAPETTVASGVAFVDGGRVIVVPGISGRLYFLDRETGDLLGPEAAGPISAIPTRLAPTTLSQSQDDEFIAVVSESRPVEIWAVGSGTLSAALEVPTQTTSVQFLTNDELVSVTANGAVRIHDLSVADWVRAACATAGRELTEAEWAQYLPDQPYQRVCENSGGAA
jgi:WD40 repeat protein